MNIESLVIHTGRGGKYHRATRDADTGELMTSEACNVDDAGPDVSEYPELPEDVHVDELCDRCFPRGE